ncbi:MAG: serine/threonine-protein phosphatase [Nitrospirae bacterium]|nr:serine/threonine-protein phosphatase [Nitrospirota bacterium]
MNAAWKTDTGLVRINNQDAVLVDEAHGIFLLADGMGGHRAGDVASALAVNEALAFIRKELSRTTDDPDVSGILEGAILRAHRVIQEKAMTDSSLEGMGTTLVELFLQGNTAYICHVGDSRAYLFRGTLQVLTRDHNLGGSYVGRGNMKREEVPPYLWHMLTQALGARECPVPDKKVLELEQGDILLLCSDGLTGMLSDDEIGSIMRGHRDSLGRMLDILIRDANSRGGRDNISAIAVEI